MCILPSLSLRMRDGFCLMCQMLAPVLWHPVRTLSLSCDCSAGRGHRKRGWGRGRHRQRCRGGTLREQPAPGERRPSMLSLQPSLSIEVWDSLYLGKVMGAKCIGLKVFWIAAVVKILQLAEFYKGFSHGNLFFLRS